MGEGRVVGYAPGVYDLFHIGHLNLLRNSAEACDHLIAGVVSDDLAERNKGLRPVVPVDERLAIVEAIRYVDQAVVELSVEDWSDAPSPFRPTGGGPFPDFSRIFTTREKLGILRRALKRWGWRGVKGALVREREIHRLLTRDRVLGLTMIKGTRWSPDHGIWPADPRQLPWNGYDLAR